jgi:hypothetical protein
VHLALASFEEDPIRAEFLRCYSLNRLPDDPRLRERAAEFLRKQGEEDSARELETGTQRNASQLEPHSVPIALNASWASTVAHAAEVAIEDAAIKKRLLGYWKGSRDKYLINDGGMMYVSPISPIPAPDRWDIRDGLWHDNGEPFKIISLTESQFVIQDVFHDQSTYTMTRITAEEANQ